MALKRNMTLDTNIMFTAIPDEHNNLMVVRKNER